MNINSFDNKAKNWDTEDKINRAQIFADKIKVELAVSGKLSALEYGAGTGLVSFCLKDYFAKIVLADSSDGMLNAAQKKIDNLNIAHISARKIDLINENMNEKFDVIYSLLTLHHINNTEYILQQFYSLLNDGGYLFIADLDIEDGSFHGDGFDGHNGFERSHLFTLSRQIGYNHIKIEDLMEIKRPELKQSYPVFVLTARK